MRTRRLRKVEHRVLRTRGCKGLAGIGAAIAAIAVAAIMSLSTAVTVDIAPDTLNVFNSTGNYVTAYIEPTVYFRDDFSDAAWTASNWQVIHGTWNVIDGQYVGQGGPNPYPNPVDIRDISLAGALMSPVEASDFVMTVKVTNQVYGSLDECALIPFRYLDSDHLVVLVFLKDRIQMQLSDSLHWHVLGIYPWSGPTDQHAVMLIAEGSSYKVYLDGAEIMSATFTPGVTCPVSYLGQRLGLWVYAQATASFDNFLVTECFDVGGVDVGSVKLWRHIFSDDFSDSAWTGGNWQVLDGIWAVEDDIYSGSAVARRSLSLAGSLMAPIEASDFTMTVKVKVLTYGGSDGAHGPQGAIIPLRYKDNNNMAALIVFSDGIRLQFDINGVWQGYAPGTPGLHDVYPAAIGNTEHLVKVVVSGDRYVIYLDDMTTPAIDKTLASAALGKRLGVWAYTNAHVHFDDFKVVDFIANAVAEPTSIGDYDSDGIPDLMVKFDRATVASYLIGEGITSGEVDLEVTGTTDTGAGFGGMDSIRVISKGKIKL